jgi:hypothetical protein
MVNPTVGSDGVQHPGCLPAKPTLSTSLPGRDRPWCQAAGTATTCAVEATRCAFRRPPVGTLPELAPVLQVNPMKMHKGRAARRRGRVGSVGADASTIDRLGQQSESSVPMIPGGCAGALSPQLTRPSARIP